METLVENAKKHGVAVVFAIFLLVKQCYDHGSLQKRLDKVNDYVQTTLVSLVSKTNVTLERATKVIEDKK